MSDIRNDHPRPNGHDRAADPTALHRAAVNKANAQKSTGPRTDAGKQRCKLNALRHGLTGHTIVLPTEDHSAYQRLARQFEHTLAQLREILAERRQHEHDTLDRAADLLGMHQEKELPYDPTQDGFVFSNDQIETFIQRRDRLSEASDAALERFDAAG
jgi:hypothetical protein